jgi:hypothetical protein
MRNATLGEALSDFVTFQLGNSTAAAVYLLRSANDVALGHGVYESGAVFHRISTIWFWLSARPSSPR